MRPKPGGKGTFVVVLPHEDEQWIADDGTGVVRYVIHDGPADVPDRRRTRPTTRPPAPGPPIEFEPSQGRGHDGRRHVRRRRSRALPTDPAKLRARIEGGEDVTLTAMVGQLLASALTPPEVKVALFAVLKQLPGRDAAPGRDRIRRAAPASASSSTPPAWKTLFLFDPQTGALLGTRSIGRKEVPGRNIDDWSLVIESGRRDDAPDARHGPHSDKEGCVIRASARCCAAANG